MAKVKKRNQVRKGTHGGMQLVLIEDVMHLGRQGDLVEVKPGYGRNFLLPNSLAVVPSEHNIRLLEQYKIKIRKDREARIADLKALAEQIKKNSITISEKAVDGEHLYGSVTSADIAKALKARNLLVETEMVRLTDPIKECGIYEVSLILGYDLDGVTPIESKVQLAVLPDVSGK
ncbi:50S ribosomal protein L9 [Tuwongella immobilis]|uniref:Large ribosomal subunit protein bL9 n=1 Tax=Tuwongella immobilis TaxID=692036 RepID=A0A6C2YU87_9BACT|nr:50S ribosomal protein L9 [Tuwongella immobilis]VIP04907.1 50s ribosomal protein l9 : 50S ribosomal protein L9 OS=Blastopirellula marina DSM 3645 GN=rplI PE=3 SV=1: Ribosomal_L9_N: Ribosomal_L9_C [Tuwongella immobilis]VTS07173.1 50s ribosomal protein l9 : 50S ribosomal protein L9 OS=Blastopirellula marina DSM 3645 GN=rplI PE=3 SV=1: Ribosomal_L9_N: Ribosomal_L9_C [Tuwongella immobilis]